MKVHCHNVQVNGVIVEVALQWCSDTFSDLLVGFVNSVKTIDGGTHIEGFKVRKLSMQDHCLDIGHISTFKLLKDRDVACVTSGLCV